MNQHKTLGIFIPYELALKLRDKGFNENCFAMYDKDKVINHSIYHQNQSNYGVCSAPTYDQAIDWFFDKYSVHVEARPLNDFGWWDGMVYNKEMERMIREGGLKTRYEALNEAIKELLKLI